jgi:Peptidase family M28
MLAQIHLEAKPMPPLRQVALLWCSVLLAAVTLAAQNPEDEAVRTIRPEGIRAHVTFLADDLLEGRGTGTRGYDLAAKYVAAQFDAMGLKPLGVKGSYFQPIRFRSIVIVPEKTSMKLTRNGIEETFAYDQDYYGVGDPRQSISSLNDQVVYVGHGVTAPDFGIDDYKGLDVHGKIVAFLRNRDPRLPSSEGAHYADMQTKLDNAAAHGSIGAIQIRDMETDSVQPFARALRQSTLPTMSWLGPNGYPRGLRDEIRAAAILSEAGTQKLFSGHIPDKPVSLPVSISITTTSRNSEVTSSNTVAVLDGSDPQLRNEYVIYTAHVDHLGIGEPVNGDAIYNGAFHNASGTACLI